jgi:hypothetical protein
MRLDDVPLDVLESAPEPDRRRRTAAAVLLVILLAAVACGWYLDHRSRQAEFAAVSGCAQQAVDEYRGSTARLTAMAEYVRPSLVYATTQTAAGLYGMVAHEAQDVGGGLQQIRDRCAALDVQPWHTSQRAALDAQLVLQDAQLRLLARIAITGSAYFEDQEQVSRERATAASALAGARPTAPW